MIAASPEDRSARRDSFCAGAAIGRHALPWLVACVIALAGCRSNVDKASAPVASRSLAPKPSGPTARREPAEDQVGWLTISLANPPATSVMGVPPENLPAYVQDLYRLRPDRRFLYAAAELARLTQGGARSGTLDIRFDGGRWRPLARRDRRSGICRSIPTSQTRRSCSWRTCPVSERPRPASSSPSPSAPRSRTELPPSSSPFCPGSTRPGKNRPAIRPWPRPPCAACSGSRSRPTTSSS